jgi:uncharacterized membrane protein
MLGLSPSAISRTLRTDRNPALRSKRRIVALSALGLLDFSIISLYQTGVIKHLPDLPGKLFDSDYVNASDEAYQLGAPDAPISAVIYGLTMVLATVGGTEKTGRHPAFDLLLGTALLANAGGAANYLVNMVTKQKKVCLYCVAGAAINFASLAVAWPDIRDGVRRFF